MEPTEYLVLLIDPACLDTPQHHPSSTTIHPPSTPTTPATLAQRADTLSNASSHSLSSATSASTTASTNTSQSSHHNYQLSSPRKSANGAHRSPRTKSKSASASASSSRSRSESRSSDGTGPLTSILRLAGLKVLTAATFEAALTLLEHRPPTESRPMLLLVDVDTDLELTPPHSPGSYSTRNHRSQPAHRNITNGRNGTQGTGEAGAKVSQANGQHHLRATSDGTVVKGSLQQHRGRRPQSRIPKQNGLVEESLCGIDFLETVLQGLAKGTLHHIVPIAVSSSASQDRIMELFNLGVADVLLKPVEEQAARTLFLNVHRYTKYRTAVTIPRYATQKSTLALPSHTRLRNVFLKDQWLSDILISHYCPTPTKMSLQDFPSMSTNAAQERVEELKNRLLSWDFHPHDLCEDDLMRCVVIVIQEVMRLDGLGDLNIPEHLLHRFVIGLRDSYHRSNPYHNFAHAVDVLQATFYFLCRMGKLPETGSGFPPLALTNGGSHEHDYNRNHQDEESPQYESKANIPIQHQPAYDIEDSETVSAIRIQDFLRPEDIFALVVASIGHDVGHPGVNNMFLVNAHTPLAQVYNDRSVLESFHSMALFQVMKKHGFECFDVDSQNRKFMEFRKMVVSTILATDMGLHFDYVGKIKEQTERLRLRSLAGGNVPKPNQASIDEQERLVLCGTLIKCADISNASRPFHVAERWSTVLLQEMCNQADIEKEMAVCSGSQPVPAGSTKSLANDRGMQIDSQLGFIHGFAMPLFSNVKDMIPEMGYCVDFLQINHAIWQERKTEYLKHGGCSVFAGLNIISHSSNNSTCAKSQHSEDEDQAQPVAPTPTRALKKPSANQHHGRAKSLAGKQPSSIPGAQKEGIAKPSGSRRGHQHQQQQQQHQHQPQQQRQQHQHASRQENDRQHEHPNIGLDMAVSDVPVKLQSGNTRRSPSGTSLNNGGATSDSSSAALGNGSSIPRPRTRTKAASSEGSVTGNYVGGQLQRGSGQHQQAQDGSNRSRAPSSRVRTATSASTLSVPVTSSPVSLSRSGRPASPSNHSQSQSQQQQSRGQRSPRSPGRRSHGHGQGKHEKTTVLGLEGHASGSHLDQPEPIVLGSLLPLTAVADPSGADALAPSETLTKMTATTTSISASVSGNDLL